MSTVEGLQVVDGKSVELLLENRSECEVRLPSKTCIAEACTIQESQEVRVDIEKNDLFVSVYDVITPNSEVREGEEIPEKVNECSDLPPGVRLEGLTQDEEVKVSNILGKIADALSRCPEDENVDLQCTRNDKSDQLNEDDNNQWINNDKDYISELNDVPVVRILDCAEIDEVVCFYSATS